MRRYNSLNNSKDGEGDVIDGLDNDSRSESTPFASDFEEGKKHTKTLFLVFTLFLGGLVIQVKICKIKAFDYQYYLF
jgi:hypothetical protein